MVQQASAAPPSTAQQQQAALAGGVVVAQIAAALATAASAALAFDTVASILGATSYLRRKALRLVLGIVDRFPLPRQEAIGAAQRFAIEQNLLRRAAYIPTSMKRIEGALARGDSAEEAVIPEHRYFAQHVQAAQQRVLSAEKIDGLRWRYGDVLGWYAYPDGKVTAECRDANGKNFRADVPPRIGWPGFVHVNCRCYPGRPHRRGVMLP